MALASAYPATAHSSVTIRFDELPFQAADGIHHAGVAFDFKLSGIDSTTDAFFGSFDPGELRYVSDPSLTGNSAGCLTLMFDVPTPLLEFGAALSTAEALSPGLSMQLFAAGGSLVETRPLDTVADGLLAFSEGRVSYSGAPISRAVIDFTDAPQNFAFDNLVFQVPEPSTTSLLTCASGILMLVRSLNRRTRRD